MLFNSVQFAMFFIAVTSSYFLLAHRFRWVLLLAASCLFYMSFIPVYILILFATIVIDYFAGLWIEGTNDPAKKKLLLSVSIISVCAILFVFKYFNFFNQNVAAIANLMGWRHSIESLRIVLPIGLSFHTFQSLSYVIEVYRGRQKAERHFGIYALYVMYFPQLVAGPIERPQNLLHQFHEEKRFDWSRLGEGLLLALWGLFKKTVVADSLALYVDAVYGASNHHSGTTLLVATYFFALQIYCDFSGYSDMAIGISKIYGVDLMKNFNTPYFSKSIGEFWTRWHISLSTWFRDYLYIPLGGNRVPIGHQYRNIMIVFLVSGLWHGANWTFVVWGGLHGLYLVGERTWATARERWSRAGHVMPTGRVVDVGRMLLTFHLVLVAWVFFRAESAATALDIIQRSCTEGGPLFVDPIMVQAVLGSLALVALEYLQGRNGYWEDLSKRGWLTNSAYATALAFAVVLFGVDGGGQFIYFQF